MAAPAVSAAARSIFRSSSVRNAASRIASGTKPTSSSFRLPSKSPLSNRIFRCPAEMSACLDTLQPFHTATASALMTSMLSLSHCYGRLPEGIDKTR
ncbi:protein NUCLEAR FUSION DEFECTIVE 6, mitochondrial-like [Impatiens glandulifera]|uniref:protein NUCLEAR FUSION DEFECTIVE 6, mitochondrial-like n=1 Tax=Impatiens glandulifera TaxID=253017 RepID=UPI001FB0DFB5|nr:protein NUCLEAR FUSION DEFECTIVE 6, mitochondrial-like [Impatiens glandulifera]